MSICDNCGDEFDREMVEEDFNSEYCTTPYSGFRRCLCLKCATEVIEECIEGEYFDTCTHCGKKFDYITESTDFHMYQPEMDLYDVDVMCCECAINYLAGTL